MGPGTGGTGRSSRTRHGRRAACGRAVGGRAGECSGGEGTVQPAQEERDPQRKGKLGAGRDGPPVRGRPAEFGLRCHARSAAASSLGSVKARRGSALRCATGSRSASRPPGGVPQRRRSQQQAGGRGRPGPAPAAAARGRARPRRGGGGGGERGRAFRRLGTLRHDAAGRLPAAPPIRAAEPSKPNAAAESLRAIPGAAGPREAGAPRHVRRQQDGGRARPARARGPPEGLLCRAVSAARPSRSVRPRLLGRAQKRGCRHRARQRLS